MRSTALAIEASGLYHIYRERDVETVALRGTSVSLAQGSWVSVMGPSGSGKSTLVHVLAGFIEPAGGSVLIGGEDITRLSATERAIRRRRSIGVVLQRDNLHPLLNVALSLRLDGRPKNETVDRTRELLTAVAMQDRARQPTSTLSGGEAQRVAIASALAARPRVLLADELTGELDVDTTSAILELLSLVHQREGAAVLTVTHNPLVADCADQCWTMRDGQLVDAA